MTYRFVLACCLLVSTLVPAWSAPASAAASPKTTVSLDLKQTPLHQALSTLFDQLGLQYSIEPLVPNPPITLKVNNMPLEEALRAMLRLGGPSSATYSKTGDLYQIKFRPPDLGAGFGGGGIGGAGGGIRGGFIGDGFPPSGQPAEPVAQVARPQAEKIFVNYLRANDAMAYLSQQPAPAGILSMQPVARDNTLVVRGDPEAIMDLKRLLQLADVPPKPLFLSAGISSPGLGGAALAIRSVANTVVGEDVTIDEQAVLGGQPAHMKVTFQTQLQGDGNLRIVSNWDVSVPVAGGPKGPIRLVKRLTTTTQVRPGEQASVAEVDLSGWGGKGVLRLWVRGDWGQPATPARSNRPRASPREAD